MKTLMTFTAFLFRHPVFMVVYGFCATFLEAWICAEAIQWLVPTWWTPTFAAWFGFVWLVLYALWVAHMFYTRARFGWLVQRLF